MADFEAPVGIHSKLRRLDTPDENHNRGQFLTRNGTLIFKTFDGDEFGWAVIAETAPGEFKKLPIKPPTSASSDGPLSEYQLRNFQQNRSFVNDEEELKRNVEENYHVLFPSPFRKDGAVEFAMLYSAPPRKTIQHSEEPYSRPVLEENKPIDHNGYQNIPGGRPLFAEIEAVKRRRRIVLLPSFEPEVPVVASGQDIGFGMAELVEEPVEFESVDRPEGIATEIRLSAYQTRLSTPPIITRPILFKDFGEMGCFPAIAYATFASTYEEHVTHFDRPIVALNHPDGKPIFTAEGYCRACGQGPNSTGAFCKWCGRGIRPEESPNPFPDVYTEDSHEYGIRGLHPIVTPKLAFAPARLFKAEYEVSSIQTNGVLKHIAAVKK